MCLPRAPVFDADLLDRPSVNPMEVDPVEKDRMMAALDIAREKFKDWPEGTVGEYFQHEGQWYGMFHWSEKPGTLWVTKLDHNPFPAGEVGRG